MHINVCVCVCMSVCVYVCVVMYTFRCTHTNEGKLNDISELNRGDKDKTLFL